MSLLKKTLKYIGLAAGILIAAALIANAIYVRTTGTSLEERLSRLREAGEPLSLADLAARPAPPGANAAAVLKRIEPELRALSKEIEPLLVAADPPRPRTENDWKALEAAYANHPTVLPGLAEAAACPSYKSPLNYQLPTMSDDRSKPSFMNELLADVQTRRQAATIIKCRVDLQLRAEDRDGAMRTCLDGIRIARHTAQEPMIISYLVVIAVRNIAMASANEILHAGPIADELHAALEAELKSQEGANAFRAAMRTERAFGLQALDESMNGGWLTRGFANDQKRSYLDQMAEVLEHADDSYAKFRADKSAAEAAKPSLRFSVARQVLPAILVLREADFRDRCLVRCLRLQNALAARKVAAAPANFADLGLAAAAIVDPYTERPLIVRRVDGQWLVYGLGKNLVDDGGLLETFEDVGYGAAKNNPAKNSEEPRTK
jgi:hypothetical protein